MRRRRALEAASALAAAAAAAALAAAGRCHAHPPTAPRKHEVVECVDLLPLVHQAVLVCLNDRTRRRNSVKIESVPMSGSKKKKGFACPHAWQWW
jgi:hypothetical protein